METVILALLGIAAFGYVARIIWRALNGKDTCQCGDSCKSCNGCCSGFSHPEKQKD
ncbi:Hypothetical protein LUCI_2937 [Lucifera butyrica]|uniref:Virus attachment protein p12 family n=1 Tax=Lucifera butyrica TaxID=1351585 RepID=A0A498RBN2_9FIRM|nr:FeoB-associated Cys-rich membrane protein [Lucifera butyrica]VBB07672.1 Hypothetical protein LUCI_2937 [Lucifera butyrica]